MITREFFLLKLVGFRVFGNRNIRYVYSLLFIHFYLFCSLEYFLDLGFKGESVIDNYEKKNASSTLLFFISRVLHWRH